MAKAITIGNGIQAASQACCRLLAIERDNQVFIKALKGAVHILWEVYTLVEDAKTFLSSCITVFIKCTFREGIRVVDWLVKFDISISSYIVSMFMLCLLFLAILIKDN